MTRAPGRGAAGPVLFGAGIALLVLLVVAARGHVGFLRRADVHIADSLNRYINHHHTQLDVWKLITDAGSPTTWRVLAVVAVVVLWLRGRQLDAVVVAVAMIGAAILSGGVKVLVGRARPTVPEPVLHAGGASFPSGHALTVFAAWGLVVGLVARAHRAAVAVAAVVVVAAVGFSRMILGVHYLTDVLGGWLIAALWLALVFAGARRWRRPVATLR